MIGTRLRDLRKSKDMTLAELAEKTGFTASYISQLERDIAEPSLTALRKLCIALNTQIYYFLEDSTEQTSIIRLKDRQKLVLPNSSVIYEFVSPMGLHKDMKPKIEVIEICVEPKEWSSDEYFNHDADEIILVLKGELLVALQDGNELLHQGDSIYLKPKVHHKFYNPTNKKVNILSIITPPIY